ncbi:hypothetical protein TNCV_1633611 [Trichonephila clavipes]|nr:hypothetical protein TNCV_1633611 [Trichonephila clavipes]
MKFNTFTHLPQGTFSPFYSEVTMDIPFTLAMSDFSYPKGAKVQCLVVSREAKSDGKTQGKRYLENVEIWMACDAEESDPVGDETNGDEDNNESRRGLSNAEAFSTLETAIE